MRRKLICLFAAAIGVFAQTSQFPSAIDNDGTLFVVADNVQTSLNVAMATGDTTAVVASAAGFVPNMIATICDATSTTGKCTAWEHMLVTAVAGNVLTVTRGFAGTSPRTHASGRLVSALIDAAHQQALKSSIIAIETALGPNLGNISAGGPLVSAHSYTFSPYSCSSSATCSPVGPSGMSLIAGNNSLTLTPVPNGVNGTDTGHALAISGGTGAAEGCLITGGSGLSGQPSGQIIINCAHAHSGAWTLSSASGGIQEAICALPAGGGSVMNTLNVTLLANVNACGKAAVQVQKMPGATISGPFTVLSAPPSSYNLEYYDPGPPWATFNTNWAGLAVNVNGFPLTGFFGSGTTGMAESIQGSVNMLPGTAVSGTGVAGYATNGSGTNDKAAVGVYGEGLSSSNNVSVWAGNFLIANCAAPWTNCAGKNAGTDIFTGYGIEIDMGITKTTGGATPEHFLRGIYIMNAGEVNANGYAVQLDNLNGVNIQAFLSSNDGTAAAFAEIGTAATGNNTGSQPIHFHARNPAGTLLEASIVEDGGGNFLLTPGGGGLLTLEDGSGNTALQVVPAGSTPYVVIANQLSLAVAAFASLPSAGVRTGAVMYCTNCTTAPVCAAGGTGHLAAYNGTNWTCQ